MAGIKMNVEFPTRLCEVNGKLRARYPDGFDADHSLHRRANDI